MKKSVLFLAIGIIMSSCITVKVYKMDPVTKVESKKPIQKKTALISSGIIARLMDRDSEIFLFGGDTEPIYFEQKATGHSEDYSKNKTFIFKGRNLDEAMQWISKLTDSLDLPIKEESSFSEEGVFILDDKNKVKIKLSSKDLKPIIIIDGKEMEITFDISSIALNSIKSIDVLKGQKALQKFGEKGKNGVIIIKLKKEE
tara:strand:- start:64 stop:663 length:600 start_codon:yes stop_codon:yes gene_type:complete